VPVAEPSGEYQVLCTLDLSPLCGKLETINEVTIIQPPADILDRRLAELNSEDENVRLQAVRDLYFFEDHGDRVFPALLTRYVDSGEAQRIEILSSMGSFPDHIKDHIDLFIEIVNNRDESGDVVDFAAYYLGQYGPRDDRVEKALEDAAAAHSESDFSESMKYALERYRKRVKREEPE
jgi:hypothetical protein